VLGPPVHWLRRKRPIAKEKSLGGRHGEPIFIPGGTKNLVTFAKGRGKQKALKVWAGSPRAAELGYAVTTNQS